MSALRAAPSLADLIDAPERAMDLPPSEAVAMLAQVGAKAGALEAVLRARLALASHNGGGPEPSNTVEADDNVTLDEAITLSGKSRRWFHDNWRKLEKRGVAFRLGRDIMFRRAKFERWRKGLTL